MLELWEQSGPTSGGPPRVDRARAQAAGYPPVSSPATAAEEAGIPSATGSPTSTVDTVRIGLPDIACYNVRIDKLINSNSQMQMKYNLMKY